MGVLPALSAVQYGSGSDRLQVAAGSDYTLVELHISEGNNWPLIFTDQTDRKEQKAEEEGRRRNRQAAKKRQGRQAILSMEC